jgi:multiple sugar transport system ATP-binding protein
MNVLHGAVDGGTFRHPTGEIRLASPAPDGPTVLGFRPEHVSIVEPGADGAAAGEIYVVEPLGNETLVAVKVGDELINVRAPADFAPSVGARCGVYPAAGHIHLFDPDSGAARRDAAADALPQPTDIPSTTQGAWHD